MPVTTYGVRKVDARPDFYYRRCAVVTVAIIVVVPPRLFPGPVLPKGEKPVVGWVVSTGLMTGERMKKYQKAARQ